MIKSKHKRKSISKSPVQSASTGPRARVNKGEEGGGEGGDGERRKCEAEEQGCSSLPFNDSKIRNFEGKCIVARRLILLLTYYNCNFAPGVAVQDARNACLQQASGTKGGVVRVRSHAQM